MQFIEKTCWYVYGRTDVQGVGMCLDNKKRRGRILGGRALYVQCMAIEVSPGMGCRVILARRLRREKTTWWHRL